MKGQSGGRPESGEDLRKRTKGLALQVVRLSATLPRRPDAQVLGHPLLRSRTSVGANYREAYRSRSDAEFLAKMGDCLKELTVASPISVWVPNS